MRMVGGALCRTPLSVFFFTRYWLWRARLTTRG
jgi:hypothetical protein